MALFDTIRVAAVQATPVILDADATIDKAVDLIGEAADRGAALVVFPECLVSLYPSGAWAAPAATWADGCDELWDACGHRASTPTVRTWSGGQGSTCGHRDVHRPIGVNEREDTRPGSL